MGGFAHAKFQRGLKRWEYAQYCCEQPESTFYVAVELKMPRREHVPELWCETVFLQRNICVLVAVKLKIPR